MNVECNHLHTQLHQLTLEGRTVSKFLSAVQDLVDSFNAIGDPISVHEHIAVIVEGLPETYESYISFINNHAEPLTVDEIETLLIGHEARIERYRKKAALVFFCTAKIR